MPRAKKKADTVNRSAAIRDYLTTHATASRSEIKSALAAKGIEVTDSLLNSVFYKSSKTGRKRKGKRGRKAASKPATNTATSISVDVLVAAASFVNRVGGIDEASKAIAVLKRMHG